MSKFIPYESPSAYLARKFRFIYLLRSLYFRFNKFDSKLVVITADPRNKLSPFFLGGLNPLLAMGKDFIDTFKPYKANYYIQRDFMQPIRGLGNVIRGLFNIVGAPLIFLVNTVRYMGVTIQAKKFGLFIGNITLGAIKTGGGLLDGINSILRGVTQLISTPLTWFLRMPLRGLITAATGKPTVCQNLAERIRELEKLIEKGGKTLEDTIHIDREMQSIDVKLRKAEERGQKTGVNSEESEKLFSNCLRFTEKKLNARGYLAVQLFGQTSHEGYTYCPHDSNLARSEALKFLGLFKVEAANNSLEQNPNETSSLIRGHQV